MSKILVGGQAVLEGVMMRAPGIMTVAVRRMNGTIQVQRSKLSSVSDRFPWMKKPFIRGILALGQALILGFRALNFSSAVAMTDVELEEKGQKDTEHESDFDNESLSGWSIALVIGVTLVLGIGFFFLLPLYLTEIIGKTFPAVLSNTILFNAIDGLIRVCFLLLYIFGIAFLPDIRRVFEYHGAEHKSIYTYEAGLPLSVENARSFSTLHPRCGTAFLLIVMVIAVFVFSLIPSHLSLFIKFTARILLLPVIAGLSFELIKKAGSSNNSLFAGIMAPGLWLQKITTKEPDDKQLEVALVALKNALDNSDESLELLI